MTGGSQPGSSACALASFQELLSLDPPRGMPVAGAHPNWLSVFTWAGIPRGAQGRAHGWLLPLATPCRPARPLSLFPLPSRLPSCALQLWQEEMWKIKHHLMSVPVELVHVRSFLSDINGRDLIMLRWAVSSTCIHTGSDFPTLLVLSLDKSSPPTPGDYFCIYLFIAALLLVTTRIFSFCVCVPNLEKPTR